MAIDKELRATGIGGSEIAALVGLDRKRDAFSIYADKLGLIEHAKPNARMRWGKLLERAIAEGYSEETGFATMWSDVTRANTTRPWQVFTIDAFVAEKPDRAAYDGLLDCKNVSFDQSHLWGKAGTDDIPPHILLQLQWYCSGTDMPWADVAALFGGNDLRIYRVHLDQDIEAAILEAAYDFWHRHVLPRVPPPIGCSQAATDYLKQRFPRNVQPLRLATPEERGTMLELCDAEEEWERVNDRCTALENDLKLAIGDAEGLMDGSLKITYRRSKDTLGTDWAKAAEELMDRLAMTECTIEGKDKPGRVAELRRELIGKYCVTLREGSRRLVKSWSRERK